MGEKCSHCPLAGKDKFCGGQKTPKLCDYTNPEHKLYNVNYISMLTGEPAMRPVSLVNKIMNYSKAVINHAKDGFGDASPEVIKERRDICSACPLLIVDKDECGACGCPIDKKIQWASEKCPLPEPKWNAYIKPKPTPPPGGCGCGS